VGCVLHIAQETPIEKILMVDDDQATRMQHQAGFASGGYREYLLRA